MHICTEIYIYHVGMTSDDLMLSSEPGMTRPSRASASPTRRPICQETCCVMIACPKESADKQVPGVRVVLIRNVVNYGLRQGG